MTHAEDIFSDRSRWIAAQAKTLELRSQLDRKFNFEDVLSTPWLRLVAEQFAREFRGDFAYMQEMHDTVVRGLNITPNQTAGILNCAVADWNRHSARPQVSELPNVKNVVDSRYRVVQADGSSLSVRLSESRTHKGERVLTYLGQGADWTFAAFVRSNGDVVLARSAYNMKKSLKAALDVLVKSVEDHDWLKHAVAFSLVGNNCCFCGRDLDTAESISMGYGPICADKYGLPWGEVIAPQQTQAEAEAEHVTEMAPEYSETDFEAQDEMARFADDGLRGHTEGVFESGSAILRKTGEKLSAFEQATGRKLNENTYRPGRSYEDIFGEGEA